jgi:sec-independent protein translocase protein TatC
VVSPDTLAAKRRHAIVGIVAFVAVITPGGDPVSLIAMTIPLVIFYEASIWLARLVLRRRRA